MKKTAAHSAASAHRANAATTIEFSLGNEVANIVWRVLLPVVALVALGAVCDKAFGTKPWLTLIGAVVGFMTAVMLVRRRVGNPEAADKASRH
jgi:F0F1-type ATP synthase assembly protein I